LKLGEHAGETVTIEALFVPQGKDTQAGSIGPSFAVEEGILVNPTKPSRGNLIELEDLIGIGDASHGVLQARSSNPSAHVLLTDD
jgi:hypothetical protein